MKSPVVKRSIVIAGHKTSVSLEDAFWKGLKEIATGKEVTLSDLVASIDTDRRHGNLSSAIRLFVSTTIVCIAPTITACIAIPEIYRVRASSTQFCVPTDAAGRPTFRGLGAGLMSVGAGNGGAGLTFGAGRAAGSCGPSSIARNRFV